MYQYTPLSDMQVLDEIGVDVASQVPFFQLTVAVCAETEWVLVLTYCFQCFRENAAFFGS